MPTSPKSNKDTTGSSILVLLKAKLESFNPYDLTWLEITKAETRAFCKDFSWSKFGEKVLGLVISLYVLYLFWPVFLGLGAIARSLAIGFAKFDLQIFLAYLPLTLFIYKFEIIISIINFLLSPSKKAFKVVWYSILGYGFFWVTFLVNNHYRDQIQAFIDSVN